PIATPFSLTPCSSPHSHDGRAHTSANVWATSSISMYWQRSGEPSGDLRAGAENSGWHSAAGRSEFFAKIVRPDAVRAPSATRLSQLTRTPGTDPVFPEKPGLSRVSVIR